MFGDDDDDDLDGHINGDGSALIVLKSYRAAHQMIWSQWETWLYILSDNSATYIVL